MVLGQKMFLLPEGGGAVVRQTRTYEKLMKMSCSTLHSALIIRSTEGRHDDGGLCENCVSMHAHLHHHGGVGHVCPPLLRPGPAHQRIGLVVVHGEVAKPRELLLDLPHGLDLLLEDGQGGTAPLQEARKGSPGFPGTAPSRWLTQTRS